MSSKIKNNYFLNSFFWSTLSKALNAIIGFVSVPLLLGYYGKANYGLLAIATACNGYMSLMDLGMNAGTVKFIAQWEAEGKRDLINRVSRTNTTFYLIISAINSILLLSLAFFGESLFSVTYEEFDKLKYCFYILAVLSPVNWVTTVYSQLLTAYKRIAFTMQIQCLLALLKGVLIAAVFLLSLTLIQYYFFLTIIIASAIIPYMIKCKSSGYLTTFRPAVYWSDFKIVLSFSLALFALSLFQVTATQSRPLILSMFCINGAEAVADFNIVQVVPSFIITICGSFTGIFLPKTSEIIIKNSREEIQDYVNTWTSKTTIIVCTLCFPFIVGANKILCAYVGPDFEHLGKWLQVWCLFLILQMHSTPAYSFVISNGRTKVLVYTTAIACILSMMLNALLCKAVPVGSAIIGYIIYMLCLIGVYYFYLYKRYLNLKRLPIFISFAKPTFLGLLCCMIPYSINVDSLFSEIISNGRIEYIFEFLTLSIIWFIPYILILLITKTIRLSDFKK